MCGIVGYFGGAANSLTRVLTAMSAIIYRAPDSTGIGVFGDDSEPLRARKAVGSVTELMDVLLGQPLYPDQAADLAKFWLTREDSSMEERQLRMLIFEQFSLQHYTALINGEETYPTFSELLHTEKSKCRRIIPGWPGRPTELPSFKIRNRQELYKLILRLIRDYDLSPVGIQALIRDALSRAMEKQRKNGTMEVEPRTLLKVFDRLFEQALSEEKVPRPEELDYEMYSEDVTNALWRFLGASNIKIPSDYDPDGVRGIFRLIDSALLSRLGIVSRLSESLQAHLELLWPKAREIYPLNWKTLYWAEKGNNVYGWAAAAALNWLENQLNLEPAQKDVTSREAQMGLYFVPGRTEPSYLCALLPPVLSQGRWALQSAVTTRNAHPFFDDRGERMIVLNGQFSGDIETRISQFLREVGGFSFRSENSSEYFALLWGYYYDRLTEEKRRFSTIRDQIEKGLQSYSIGSQSIDYQIYHWIGEKSAEEVDELAFIETARQIVRDGGQVAVGGLSLLAPDRMLVASHNRPVFIVRRPDTEDFMVVSDINAAMGLFSQKKITRITQRLNIEKTRGSAKVAELQKKNAPKKVIDEELRKIQEVEKRLLRSFTVQVHALEGREIFAKISSAIKDNKPVRTVSITDFEGNAVPEVEPFTTHLSPPQVQKEFYTSFYEAHLNEIPRRLLEILYYHAPSVNEFPDFKLKSGFLLRRFGHDFKGLKRIIISGMGSAYNMALAAQPFLQNTLPNLEVIPIKPVEMENPLKVIFPEKDLVVLLSWSGTTAEMVQFADLLKHRDIAFVAVTEKAISDLGLIAGKSAGIISTMTGEEITVSGVKSTVCMLFCLFLLGIWLCSRIACENTALRLLKKMHKIPEILSRLLEDEKIEAFCKNIARESSDSHAHFIIDSLQNIGTGREVALKLEESSWNSLGRFIDHDDFLLHGLKKSLGRNLVLVSTTHKRHHSEALEVMKKFYLEKVPFVAITVSNREISQMELFSNHRIVRLPRVDTVLQPLVDLVFYYLFSFHYGIAHGRMTDFPRNRAKSVTAGRTLWPKPLSPVAEIHLLESHCRKFPPLMSENAPWFSVQTPWESMASGFWEKAYYKEARLLSKILVSPDPLSRLLDPGKGYLAELRETLAKALAEEREIIVVPLDRPARAAAQNIRTQWNRLVASPIRVFQRLDSGARLSLQGLVILLASRPTYSENPRLLSENSSSGYAYIGPSLPESAARNFKNQGGAGIFSRHYSFCESDLAYISVCFLFIEALKRFQPVRAATIERFFKGGGQAISSLLNHRSLKENIDRVMAANSRYKTGIFIGPQSGIGELIESRFDHYGEMLLQHNVLGEGAHGPLVTVDSRVNKKYVRLAPRNQMIPQYGQEQVSRWEEQFLGGNSTDVFLNRSATYLTGLPQTPFFAENDWYFPVLRQDYDTYQDNLVIVDATSERHLEQVQDELAVFGCRYARMIVICQEAFLSPDSSAAFYKYPISHMLVLPPPFENTEHPTAASGLILPMVMSIISMALAAATKNSNTIDKET